MTPRTTDWSLVCLVALLFATGVLSLVSGSAGDAWVFALHGAGGAALGLVTVWKLRRVWRRVVSPRRWDRRTIAGVLATALVVGALATGWAWSSGADLYAVGFNLLNWHMALGVWLTIAVSLHARLRARPLRGRDLVHRRQFLHMTGIATGALAGWRLQRPASASLGWRGARRRWTGSYERGSFEGNGFPSTSWVADRPRPLPADTYRLKLGGLVAEPMELSLAALDAGDTVVATLDCTGGFYSTQRWWGVRLQRVIEAAKPLSTATHIRIVSHTGYRWSFPLSEARDMLLATGVGDELLSHQHGAPVRLVAPNRRGFQWVKWVVCVELHVGPDRGAAASTIWSSWTPAGRGRV